MATQRKVEIFSAGCSACQETIDLVNKIACPSCTVEILDMANPDVGSRAKALGIQSIPAIVVNGELASCCQGRGLTEAQLREAGIGKS